MSQKVVIKVPATSANCGAGFDTLGLACNLYNEFTYELIPEGLELTVDGEGSDFLTNSKHNLAFVSFFEIWNKLNREKTGLRVHMKNLIPLSRGLGSSSTAIVAGLIAANHFAGNKFSKNQLVDFATKLEGHPDNVAPAILGGFTISFVEEGKAFSLKLDIKKELKLVAVIPDMPLATKKARAAIPASIKHTDAVFNVSRASLLVGALLSGEYDFLSYALEDKLHQPYRLPLINGAKEAFQAAKDNGAYNAIISGAGSTLMAYVPADVDGDVVGSAMVKALGSKNMKSHYLVLNIDSLGARVV